MAIEQYFGNLDTATFAYGFYIFEQSVRYLHYQPAEDRIAWGLLPRNEAIYSPHGTFRFAGFDGENAVISLRQPGVPQGRCFYLSPKYVVSIANEFYWNPQSQWNMHNGVPRERFMPMAQASPVDLCKVQLERIRAVDISALTPQEFDLVCLFEDAFAKIVAFSENPKGPPAPTIDQDGYMQFMEALQSEHPHLYLELGGNIKEFSPEVKELLLA